MENIDRAWLRSKVLSVAAEFNAKRHGLARDRAIRAGRWARATFHDGRSLDYWAFLCGDFEVWPGLREWREGHFTRSHGRYFGPLSKAHRGR